MVQNHLVFIIFNRSFALFHKKGRIFCGLQKLWDIFEKPLFVKICAQIQSLAKKICFVPPSWIDPAFLAYLTTYYISLSHVGVQNNNSLQNSFSTFQNSGS
jgi:hypothetical protein